MPDQHAGVGNDAHVYVAVTGRSRSPMNTAAMSARLAGAIFASLLCLGSPKADAQRSVGCFVNGRQVADSMCQPGALPAPTNPAAGALVNSMGALGTAVINKLLEDKPQPAQADPGAAAREAERQATLQRAMQVKSDNEQRRRQEQEENSRAFRDSQNAVTTQVRSLDAQSAGGALQVREELRDALNDPPSSSTATAKSPQQPPANNQAAQRPKPLPVSVGEIPADWSCYPADPQENGAWEYLQCAGSNEEHGRLHCFEKRGDSLSPIACFR
jgi:hypothetical protein